ncbi:hypothetical protein ACFSJU_14725 [Paradesertivirga mongoliensis]|uniref:Uncharacterized protein n=1 Tax=Paradesertivirga mongoliensis TaxID=2100740 RepID=A0ABW4ZP97_9SPHI|nr:hypothetical protein [Pedobacter mongoliensis]
MLEIINERGEVMEVSDNLSIPVERYNPLFNDSDKFFQDITYPGKAPISPANKAFFSGGHYVDTENSLYEFPVRISVSGFMLFKGVCQFKIGNNAYDFTLKVNFGALASNFKTVKLTDIRTNDSYGSPLVTTAGWEIHMKDTCVNPHKYNYAFLPVFNDGVEYFGEEVSTTTNLWDYANQKFKITPPSGKQIALDYMVFNTPYFKLTYLIKKTIEALGFVATGNFFTTQNDQIYVWNPYNCTLWGQDFSNDGIYLAIQNSAFYAPDAAIGEFFKILREDPRLKLTFSFDLLNATIRVDSFSDIMNDPEHEDISEYIEEITEMEVKSTYGFSITLAPDTQDANFLTNATYLPTARLVVGDGSKAIEVSANSLKYHNADMLKCKRKVTRRKAAVVFSSNTLPLRLIRFTGMREAEPGKFIPHCEPMELSTAHARFYEFIASAKKITSIATVPVSVLSRLDTSKKLQFYYQGVNVPAILEKLAYDMQGKARVKVKIDCYSLLNSAAKTSRVEQVIIPDAESYDGYTVDVLCAFFNTQVTGITTVIPVCIKAGKVLNAQEIKVSTDDKGLGGQKAFLLTNSTEPGDHPPSYELRIKESKPRYAERMGVKYLFAQGDGYWYTTIHETLYNYDQANSLLNGYFGPLWIVF